MEDKLVFQVKYSDIGLGLFICKQIVNQFDWPDDKKNTYNYFFDILREISIGGYRKDHYKNIIFLDFKTLNKFILDFGAGYAAVRTSQEHRPTITVSFWDKEKSLQMVQISNNQGCQCFNYDNDLQIYPKFISEDFKALLTSCNEQKFE